MSKGLSGAGRLSDCPCSQSIASGLNPSLDVFEAMLFCCLLYYGKKHTKMEARAAACTEGKQERNQCFFEWCSKDWELGWFLPWFRFELRWQEQYYSHRKSSVNSVLTHLCFLLMF